MGLDRGELTFLMRPEQAMQFIAVRDIGRVVAAIFGAPERFADRTVELRTAFPFLLRFDQWLQGPGKALLTDALGPARTRGTTR